MNLSAGYWNTIIICGGILIGIWLCVQAYRRPSRANLTWRLLATIVAIVALILLGTGLSFNRDIETGGPDAAVLITTGAPADSIRTTKANGLPLYAFDESIAATESSVKYIRSFRELAGIGKIDILGYGLEDWQLDSARQYPFQFDLRTPSISTGFRSVHWPGQLYSGEEFAVTGRFSNGDERDEIKLVLSGFGTSLDSMVIKPGDDKFFRLHTVPKHNGRAVFTLELFSGKNKTREEKIPFEIISTPALKILVLNNSPDFESRFLKNWLFSNKYAIATRNLVSKNIFSKEVLNMPDVNVDNITPSLLEKFDMVISSATALSSMPGSQLFAIRNAVQSRGLGLIVRADSITSSSLFYNTPFRLAATAINNKDQLQLLGTDSSTKLSPLTVDRPLHIASIQSGLALFRNTSDQQFGGAAISGRGKILYTTINNSYSWLLSGDSSSFRKYWSTLIANATKKQGGTEFTIQPSIPITGGFSSINVQSGDSLPFLLEVNGQRQPIRQDYRLPFTWTSPYWATKAGWQKAEKDGSSFHWYVFTDRDWKDVRGLAKADKNRQQIAGIKGGREGSGVEGEGIDLAPVEVNKAWFALVFFICCIYLWIEEKYQAGRN